MEIPHPKGMKVSIELVDYNNMIMVSIDIPTKPRYRDMRKYDLPCNVRDVELIGVHIMLKRFWRRLGAM